MSLNSSTNVQNSEKSNVEFCDRLLGPCDPRWRFPTVCMVGLVFGLENVCIHTYIYRQAGFVLGGFAQALPGGTGDGECTMDPGCGPNFVLPQGQKDGEKFRSKAQKFWCTLSRAMKQRILGYRTPPCHRRPVIATQSSISLSRGRGSVAGFTKSASVLCRGTPKKRGTGVDASNSFSKAPQPLPSHCSALSSASMHLSTVKSSRATQRLRNCMVCDIPAQAPTTSSIKCTFNMHVAFALPALLGISVTQRLCTTSAGTCKTLFLPLGVRFLLANPHHMTKAATTNNNVEAALPASQLPRVEIL